MFPSKNNIKRAEFLQTDMVMNPSSLPGFWLAFQETAIVSTFLEYVTFPSQEDKLFQLISRNESNQVLFDIS